MARSDASRRRGGGDAGGPCDGHGHQRGGLGPGGHVTSGELGQVIIGTFGQRESAAMSQAHGGHRVAGAGPGGCRERQVFPRARRRRRRLVPGGKLRLRVPGTGIAGERRVATGRIAPRAAGRTAGSGRAAARPGRAAGPVLVTWPGCGPGTGLPGLSLAGPRHPRCTQLRDIPLAGEPGLPPPGLATASGRHVTGRGEIEGLAIERTLGRHIGVLPGRVRPPLLRWRGDLIARQTHVGSVSLRAAPNALSGVFPGRCRGEGVFSGSRRGREGSPRRRAADDGHHDAAWPTDTGLTCAGGPGWPRPRSL